MATSVRQWGDQVTKEGTENKGDVREGASPKQIGIQKKRELQKQSLGRDLDQGREQQRLS